MADAIDNALTQIGKTLATCEAECKKLTQSAQILHKSSVSLLGMFVVRGEALSAIFTRSLSIAESAIGMTYDLEIGLTDENLTKRLGTFQLTPIIWQDGDNSFQAVPKGALRVVSSLPGVVVRDGHSLIESLWSIRLNNGTSLEYHAVIEFRLSLHLARPKVRLSSARALQFYGAKWESASPIAMIPFAGKRRLKARQTIEEKIQTELGKVELAFPSIDTPQLRLNATPLASFARGALLIFCKLDGLPLRRAPYAIARIPNRPGFDLFVRIKSDVLVQQLSTVVKAIDNSASVVDARYAGGAFRFTVSVYRKQHECIAEARIWASINFLAYVQSRGRTELMFDASQESWSARWEIDWCFHKCGEASRRIDSELRATISQHKRKTVSLSNFSSIARNVSGWMDPFGLNIQMEAIDV